MRRNYRFVVVCVLILIMGLLGWQYVIVTPQYSVYQMRQAVKEHDYAKFQKYVDVDAVSDNIVDDVLSDSKNGTGNSWLQFGAQMAQGVIQSVKPAVKKEFKDTIKKGVETGSIKRLVYKEDNLYTTMRTVKVEKDGEIAIVTIPTTSKPLYAKMRQVNDHWQIYEMDLSLEDLDTTN